MIYHVIFPDFLFLKIIIINTQEPVNEGSVTSMSVSSNGTVDQSFTVS